MLFSLFDTCLLSKYVFMIMQFSSFSNFNLHLTSAEMRCRMILMMQIFVSFKVIVVCLINTVISLTGYFVLVMGGSPSCQVAAVDMSGPEAKMVKEKIKTNCVMIFSKTYCPYCKMAKKVISLIPNIWKFLPDYITLCLM